MCDPIIGGAIAAGIAGSLFSSKAPKAPKPPEPPAQRQPQRQPGAVQGRGSTADRGAGFGFGQVGNTLLTGSRGAQVNPGQLGGTKLLGG